MQNKMNQSKQTSYCHSRPDRESMFGSAWKVEDNLNGSCQRVNGFRTKSGMTGECGRSMVEMLGVLAIIGVLSVGGIAGYTMAMNKHRANEILNAASVRAMVVSTQIQSGTSPTLVEFGSEKVGNVSITLNPYTTGDATFSFSLATVDESVCSQMKNIISTDSQNPKISDDANCATLTYNKDLGEGTSGYEESAPSKCPGDVDPAADGTCEDDACTDNSNCPGKYCQWDYNTQQGTCTTYTKVSDAQKVSWSNIGKTAYITTLELNQKSAKNFCEANNLKLPKLSDLGITISYYLTYTCGSGEESKCIPNPDCVAQVPDPSVCPPFRTDSILGQIKYTTNPAFVGTGIWLDDDCEGCTLEGVSDEEKAEALANPKHESGVVCINK